MDNTYKKDILQVMEVMSATLKSTQRKNTLAYLKRKIAMIIKSNVCLNLFR